MKKGLLILAMLLTNTLAHAGIIGWATAEARDWDFICKTGGIRISQPVQKAGKTFLPVTYDVSGLTTVTHAPTLINSGLAVKKIAIRRDDTLLLIHVVTQVFEQGAQTGPLHAVNLDDIPAGRYQVFYETAGPGGAKLGEIELQ